MVVLIRHNTNLERLWRAEYRLIIGEDVFYAPAPVACRYVSRHFP